MSSPETADPFLLKTDDSPPILVLSLRARSLGDETSADTWFQQDRALVAESGVSRVILDCEEVDMVYGAGLSKLLRLYRDLHVANGQLVLCRVPDTLREIMQITRLDKILKSYPDLEAAVAVVWGLAV